MTNKQIETILEKLAVELNPEFQTGDWDKDFGFELGIYTAIKIIKETTGYDTRKSSGNS